MPSIPPRARCGLPTNPREWLQKNKSPPAGTIPLNSLVTVERGNAPPYSPMDPQSPIIQGTYEELIESYKSVEKPPWTKPSGPGSMRHGRQPPSTAAGPARILKSSMSERSYASDRSSSVSEGSNVSFQSSVSDKSERRKRRIFPGIFPGPALLEPPSSHRPSTPIQKLASLASNLSLNPASSNLPSQPKKTLHHTNLLKSQPTFAANRGLRLRDPSSERSKKEADRPSEPLPDTALREPDPGEPAYWDELAVFEAYSALDTEPSYGDDPALEREPSYPAASSSQVRIKLDLVLAESHEYAVQDARYMLPRSGQPLLSPAPLSACSDYSRYSVESA